MKRRLGFVALSLIVTGAWAQAPEVTLTRIDCGTGAKPTNVNERFSDTFAYKDLNLVFTELAKSSSLRIALDPCALVLVANWDRELPEPKEQQFFCHFALL